jgi:hypothetical protein
MHGTKMDAFHRQIADQQRREGVRVITPPHGLGFLDPHLPEKSRPLQPDLGAVASSNAAQINS